LDCACRSVSHSTSTSSPEVFIQAVPTIDLLFGDYYHFGVHASVGLRYWFK
jgi:hypothetical protein